MVDSDFSNASIDQKNNDRIAVNLRRLLASFWIDVRGQEVKAKRYFAVPRATVYGSRQRGEWRRDKWHADSIIEHDASFAQREICSYCNHGRIGRCLYVRGDS